jgi:hypothetical protein
MDEKWEAFKLAGHNPEISSDPFTREWKSKA